MFTEWAISNFKSIRRKTTLKLAPLTVLAGTNSSGKTSFLQSILMVAQTARSRKGQPHLLLNGSLARLGRFEDVCPYGSVKNGIDVAWAYEHQYSKKLIPIGDMETGKDSYPERPKEITACSLTFSFGPDFINPKADPPSAMQDKRKRPNKLLLSKFELDFDDQAGKLAKMGANLRVKHNIRMKQIRGKVPYFWASQSFEMDPDMFENYCSEIINRLRLQSDNNLRFSPQILGAEFENFLPSDIILTYDYEAYSRVRCIDLLGQAFTAFKTGTSLPPGIAAPFNVSKGLAKKIESYIPTCLSLTKSQHAPAHVLSDDALSFAEREINEICAELRNSFKTTPKSEWDIEGFGLPDILAQRLKIVKNTFTNKLWYVGPLRAAPNIEYPLSDDPSYVGSTGEFTAAVLEAEACDSVEAFIPGQTGDRTDLSSALNSWLEYLGLGVKISSEEHPTGYRIKIHQAGSARALSLANVGVGVSQILPILVQGLLAPEDSVLIFEQPELHLHPKSQSRLADFFIGLSRSGRQCIVETHSEHIINRIRRRMLESTEPEQDEIKIYFTTKKKTGTHYQAIKMNPQGAIQDWPADFFDESEIEIGEIARAAARSRFRGHIK